MDAHPPPGPDRNPWPPRDHVTGLATRAEFETWLGAGCSAGTALALCDVIGLKKVNESTGFRHGDGLLRRAAERLRDAAGDAVIVARLGGDELVAVFAGSGAVGRATEVAQRLRAPGDPPLRCVAGVVREAEEPWVAIERLYASLRSC